MPLIIPKNEILNGYEYLRKFVDIVDHARSSIFISMYIWRMDIYNPSSPINELNHSLFRACARGVHIYSVTNFGDVVCRLRKSKIEAYKYAGPNCFHNKIVVVDSIYYFIGSHNFSNHALTSNIEVSICAFDPVNAQRLENFIRSIKKIE